MSARQDVDLDAITVELGSDDHDRPRSRASRPARPAALVQDAADVLHGDLVAPRELGNGLTAGMASAEVVGLQPGELVDGPFDVLVTIGSEVLRVEAAAASASTPYVVTSWDRLAVGEFVGDAGRWPATVDGVTAARPAGPGPARSSAIDFAPEVFRRERGHGVLIVVDLEERW